MILGIILAWALVAYIRRYGMMVALSSGIIGRARKGLVTRTVCGRLLIGRRIRGDNALRCVGMHGVAVMCMNVRIPLEAVLNVQPFI